MDEELDGEQLDVWGTEEHGDSVVLEIGLTHVLIGLGLLAGIGAALVAGLWIGRSARLPSVWQVAGGQPAPPAAIAPRQVIPLQPQVPGVQLPQRLPAQPAAPSSSAGITTAIGRTPTVGDMAPHFTLKNLTGEQVSLSDYKGRPVLINFWATWCGPCRIEMPLIEQMYQTYRDEGFVVLAVDVQESITVVRSFVDSLALTFPILLDLKGEVADGPYRLRAFPTSYFVGRDGKITAVHRGMMTQPMMQRYMDQVLATQP